MEVEGEGETHRGYLRSGIGTHFFPDSLCVKGKE